MVETMVVGVEGVGIDLTPLKDVLSYPQLRETVDLKGIDVQSLFEMDVDLDGQVLSSEYPKEKTDEFLLVREKVKDIARELEMRKQGRFYPHETSLHNCDYVVQALDEFRASLPVNAIFYCRDEMLSRVAKTMLSNGRYVVKETNSPRRTVPSDLVDVVSKIPSDERADVIIAMMEKNFEHAVLLIKYASEADRFRLYSLAYAKTTDYIKKCDILSESKNITDENLRNTMYWTGLKDENSSLRGWAFKFLATPDAVAFGLEDPDFSVKEQAIKLIPSLPVERQGVPESIVRHKLITIDRSGNYELNKDNAFLVYTYLDVLPDIKDEDARRFGFTDIFKVKYGNRPSDAYYLRAAVMAMERLSLGEQYQLIEVAAKNKRIKEGCDVLRNDVPLENGLRLRIEAKLDELKERGEITDGDGDSPAGCSISGF